jgi:hypothetical protein
MLGERILRTRRENDEASGRGWGSLRERTVKPRIEDTEVSERGF